MHASAPSPELDNNGQAIGHDVGVGKLSVIVTAEYYLLSIAIGYNLFVLLLQLWLVNSHKTYS